METQVNVPHKLDTWYCTGIIVFRRNLPNNIIEYLLMESKRHFWGPPKGHIEPGEAAYETALRETREESGLDQINFKVIPDFNCELSYEKNWGKVGHVFKHVTFWMAEVNDSDCEITLSSEHKRYKWLQLEEAKDFAKVANLEKGLLECLEKCEEKIQNM